MLRQIQVRICSVARFHNLNAELFICTADAFKETFFLHGYSAFSNKATAVDDVWCELPPEPVVC